MKRYFLTLFVVIVVALVAVTPVSAYYSSFAGELKDLKTLGPWNHGAVVTLYDTNGNPLTSHVVPSGQSSFNITYDFTPAPALVLVEVDFTCEAATGCDGGDDPANDTFFGIHGESDTGTWDTGTYVADTGPNAVSMAALSGTSGLALMGVLPLAAVAGLGAVKLNRKKRH